MNLKCEICGFTEKVDKFYACGCNEKSESAFLCQFCREKIQRIPYALPSIPIGWTFAQYISWILHGTEKLANNRKEKEDTTMQVTYNGFTGELVKLEKINLPPDIKPAYNLPIFCNEKKVIHSFSCINLEDVKFLGGAVSFGG